MTFPNTANWSRAHFVAIKCDNFGMHDMVLVKSGTNIAYVGPKPLLHAPITVDQSIIVVSNAMATDIDVHITIRTGARPDKWITLAPSTTVAGVRAPDCNEGVLVRQGKCTIGGYVPTRPHVAVHHMGRALTMPVLDVLAQLSDASNGILVESPTSDPIYVLVTTTSCVGEWINIAAGACHAFARKDAEMVVVKDSVTAGR
ncbi:hypothetical protein AMAG_15030 [Allomyces macrogynus ATCC 38327]|uniref:Uncharacterized protein n=1 Tax=Allomyces macrogynus (strain ATCC 38327) TaxID=578462 RepID=A0A0L0T5M0_ALLM3|nr:hypothetical protein AMAG_15030 [Allomyces macrogynus ATCC 38327]|eukprot:KNE70040.1 hypothetical protein AMAG_15030 [Allomyces macrogynus ATCC 38327]